MSAADHQAALETLRQRHAAAQSKLKTDLIAGVDTSPTRSEIAAFARQITAEVQAWKLDVEQVSRVRHGMNRKVVENLCTDIAERIDAAMSPLAIPAPIVEPKI